MSAISSSVSRLIGRDPATTPTVTIILAVFDPPIDALRSQLQAIAAQTSHDWECIVVDDASRNADIRALLDAWCSFDTARTLVRRTTNGGIAAATNDALDRATGHIVTICDHDDVVRPGAIASIIDHFASHPEHDVVYTDEQLIDAAGGITADYRKPDYSPRRHLGHHFLAHLVAARRAAVGDLRVRAEFEPSQDYDFYLRVIEAARHGAAGVGHIDDILYSWRAIEGSSALDAGEKPEMAAAVERCVQSALDRRSIAATARTVLHRGTPTTSVRLEMHTASAATLLMVDYSADSSPAVINALVARSEADVLCFLPAGAQTDHEWARPLVTAAVQPGVGAVGPLVVTASTQTDDEPALLSVGRTLIPTLDDPFSGTAANEAGPWGAFLVSREVSAVAPAGMTLRRELFNTVGGLSTDVGLDVAVAEMCTQLRVLGHAVLVDPSVRLELDERRLIDDGQRQAIDDDLSVAAGRTRQLRHEYFDTTGLPPAFLSEPNPYGAARRAILSGSVELVTSDVFDTLVTRPVATPSDLFVTLGARLADLGLLAPDVTPRLFAEGRRSAERRARQRLVEQARAELGSQGLGTANIETHATVVAPECTLHEVWALIPADWLIGATTDQYVEHEIDLESSSLQPISAVLEVFALARRRDIPVVLVSDIYFGRDQLIRILERVGIDMRLVSEVVTSADHRLGKAHGLLADVIAQRDVDPRRVLHIGDNEVADVATAEHLGAQAIHVEVPGWIQHVERPSAAIIEWSRSRGSDLGVSATVRTALVEAGPLGRDPSYQFGAALMGPALAGFSRWVSASTHRLGASTVHCMLREGATIAELMAITAPDGAATVPLHVSRWVTMRAAVIEGSPDELLTALARRAELSVDHVAGAFDVDPALAADALGTDHPDITEACRRIADHDELRSHIVAASADLRARVLLHLRSTLEFDDGPIVVADVGWGGTIQEGLERILRSDGITNEVIGLYFALSSAGEERIRRGARMESYLPNEFVDPTAARSSRAVAHHADTIERIMTPDIGTLIDISSTGAPITRPVGHDPIPPSLHTAQRALREVVERLARSESGISDLNDERWVDDLGLRSAFARSIADAVTTPKPTLAEALGAWPHDDVAGTDHRSIAGQGLSTAATYGNARDLDLIDPSGRNWVPGLASTSNPALPAQLAASDAGISLASLCPDNENGLARLAAFPVASDLAALQVGRVPGVAPAGWSLVRISGSIDSLRSIRFDAGEHNALVDIAHFSIDLRTDRLLDPEPRLVDLHDPDLVWVSSHPLDAHHFAQEAGGHLIVQLAPDLARDVRWVEATVAFRCWRLDRDDSLVATPVLQRADAQRRRVVDGVKRRLQR